MERKEVKRAEMRLVFVVHLALSLLLVACQPVMVEQASPTVPAETPVEELLPDTGVTPTVEAPVETVVVPTPETVVTPAPTLTPTQSAAGEVVNQEVQVTIIDSNFQPGELTVSPGTTVMWTNSGNFPHTVTADDGSFDSGRLQVGDSFEYTFDEPGTYPYHCEIHGATGGLGMSGIIVVEGP